MNRDQFHSTAAHAGLEDAFLALDGVQSLPPHRQVLAVVLLFRLLQKELGLETSQLLDMADRMSHDADTRFHHHIHALREYIRREIKAR